MPLRQFLTYFTVLATALLIGSVSASPEIQQLAPVAADAHLSLSVVSGQAVSYMQASYPFEVKGGQVIFVQNFSNSAGCAWQGIGGQVFNTKGTPVNGFKIQVSGTHFYQVADSGSNYIYGPSGWEVHIDNQISAQTYEVQLLGSDGSVLSSKIKVTFPSDCARNLALVNFVQTSGSPSVQITAIPPAVVLQGTNTPSRANAVVKQVLNVRSGPNTSFDPPLGRLTVNQTVGLLARSLDGQWFKIAYGGGTGWIFAAYVKPSVDPASLPVDGGPLVPTLTLLPSAMPTQIPPTRVEDANLIWDGDLEEGARFGPYRPWRSGEFPVEIPVAWNYWFGPRLGRYSEQSQHMTIRAYYGINPAPYSGDSALIISCDHNSTCPTVIYQRVLGVKAGEKIYVSAWSQAEACNSSGKNSCGQPTGLPETRIGIDPNGRLDAESTSVIWSPWIMPEGQWTYQSVNAITVNTNVSVFLSSWQQEVVDVNKTYWDAVSLLYGEDPHPMPTATATH